MRTNAGLAAMLVVTFSGLAFGASAQDASANSVQPLISGGPYSWVLGATADTDEPLCIVDRNGARTGYEDCNGGPLQRWTHSQDQRGNEIRNAGTGLCLTGVNDRNGTVTTQACDNSTGQRWILTQDKYGYEMKNALVPLCLQAAGGHIVVQFVCHYQGEIASQRWLNVP